MAKNVAFVLTKEGEQDIVVNCPERINLGIFKALMVVRGDIPPWTVSPKDWKGFFILMGLFLGMILMISLPGIVGYILGSIMLVVNIFITKKYYFSYIQKKINNGYTLSPEQEELARNSSIKIKQNEGNLE